MYNNIWYSQNGSESRARTILPIIWVCCTAISAGNMADGSRVTEGSHMAGTSTGILRAEEEAVKESKQGTAKKMNTV